MYIDCVTWQENVQWQVTAEFHRLNVLLMRVDDNELRQVAIAMKVATATLSDAKIEAHLGECDCTSCDGRTC